METGFLKIDITFEYHEDESFSNVAFEGNSLRRVDTAYALASLVNQLSVRFKDVSRFRSEFIMCLLADE